MSKSTLKPQFSPKSYLLRHPGLEMERHKDNFSSHEKKNGIDDQNRLKFILLLHEAGNVIAQSDICLILAILCQLIGAELRPFLGDSFFLLIGLCEFSYIFDGFCISHFEFKMANI